MFIYILGIAGLLYVVWALGPVKRFHRKIFIPKLTGRTESWWYRGSWYARYPMWLFVYFVEICLAPLLLYRVRKHDQEEADQRWREIQNETERRRVAKEIENRRRGQHRKEWLAKNQLVLYCKTVAGITAVVSTSEYDKYIEKTRRERRNETWQHKDVLLPIPTTVTFVTQSGYDLVRNHLVSRKYNTDNPFYFGVSGWLTDLDDLVKEYNVQIELKDDIFVPFVNDALVPFEVHPRNPAGDRYRYFRLVIEQIPVDLRPV